MRIRSFIILLACCGSLLGCTQGKKPRLTARTSGVEERVGETAILRLGAPAFSALSQNDRAAVWYLSQAILAGRDITCDQIYPGQNRALRFAEKMSANLAYGVTPGNVEPYFRFVKVLQFHNGFYDLRSARKVGLGDFNPRLFTELLFVALANSGGELGSLIEVNLMRNFLVDTLLYPTIDPVLCRVSQDSARSEILPLGFYNRISLAEASKFAGRFPFNSRLVRRDSTIVEQVCRAGDEETAPGLYATELTRVIENLEKGRPYLPPERVPAVDLLIRHLRSGEPAAFDSAAALWRSGSTPVDFLLGFCDTRFDPLGSRGLWTGFLSLRDEAAQTNVDRLLQVAKELQTESLEEGSQPAALGQIKAVQLLTATGADGPRYSDVYRDPPCPDSISGPGQSLIFINVLSARAQARAQGIESLFCRDAADSSLAVKWAADLAFVQTVLAEYGHAILPSEAECRCCNGGDVNRNVLQEVLVQAQSWRLMGEPILATLGLIPTEAAGQIYRSLGRQYLVSLGEGAPEGGNPQPLQILGNYLVETGALKLEKVSGRTICEPTGAGLVRQKLAVLADSLNLILADSGAQQRRAFVSKYSRPNPAGLTEEITSQLQQARAFREEAFILPIVAARFNPMGGLEAVRLEQPESFAEEMLIYGGLETGKQK
jgi:dipeptidyl-peptidase-3